MPFAMWTTCTNNQYTPHEGPKEEKREKIYNKSIPSLPQSWGEGISKN